MRTGSLKRTEVFTSPDGKERLQRFRGDVAYIGREKRRLLEKYAEQWVGILGERVVAHDAHLEKLLAKIDKQGLRRDEVVVDFLTRREQVLIL